MLRVMGRMGGCVGAAVALVSALLPTPAAAAVPADRRPVEGWGVDGVVRAVAVAGGTTYVGGTFGAATAPDGTTRPAANLVAFDTRTGAPVERFRADTDGAVHALVSDGSTVWVGGAFTTIGGERRLRLAAVDAGTGEVRPFRADATGHVNALDLSGGRLFAAGSFLSVSGQARTRAAAFDATSGAVDPDWKPAPDDTVLALRAAAGGGTVYLGGHFGRAGRADRRAVAEVSGSTGAATATEFEHVPAPVLTLDTDGHRLFGGMTGTGGVGDALSAWDTSTGRRVWHQPADGDVQAVAHHRGTVYFGFHEGFGGDRSVRLLAASAADGVVDPSFRPSFDRFWGVYALDVSDDWLVAGGDVGRVSGVAAPGVVRFPMAPGEGGSPAPGGAFTDIGNAEHAANIRKVADAGIAVGYADGTYRPQLAVSRGQMATFLHRAFGLPDGEAGAFSDVGADEHRAGIAAVARAGIAEGHADGTFRPSEPVTREQMASFLRRALDLPPADPGFPDVSGTHAPSVGAVVTAGIAEGHPDGTYRPRQPVSRAQMASFLARALDV